MTSLFSAEFKDRVVVQVQNCITRLQAVRNSPGKGQGRRFNPVFEQAINQ